MPTNAGAVDADPPRYAGDASVAVPALDAGPSRRRRSLTTLGLTGGTVSDAFVASAALAHGWPLLTRDRRAVVT